MGSSVSRELSLLFLVNIDVHKFTYHFSCSMRLKDMIHEHDNVVVVSVIESSCIHICLYPFRTC